MTPELLNKLKHLANIAAHLPFDVTLEDEDAAMKALHGELAADTVLQMIALAEHSLSAQDEVISDLNAINCAMQYMGDQLNEMDVVEEEDVAIVTPGFEAISRLLATPSPSLAVRDVMVDDLAMLVRRLVRSLEKANPGTDLAPQALDYLKRKGLQDSPLRTDKPNADCSGEPANCPDNEGYGCACDPMNKAGSAKP